MMYYVKTLTIAGSDSGGGAGIQADIKTMSALGCYASSVVTAVTAQNTIGVYCVQHIEAKIVEAQLRAVLADLRPHAIKTGMMGSAGNMESIAKTLSEVKDIPLIVDPVMVSTSGHKLMDDDAIRTFDEYLLPLATLLTPNIPEAEVLARMRISSVADMDEAAKMILGRGCKALLIKGGHIEGKVKSDRLYFADNRMPMVFDAETIVSRNTHGTGCTLSSAVCAFMARGFHLEEAVAKAKAYVSDAIRLGADVEIGSGHGAVNHFYNPEKLIKQ
uniref:hydroxymethylpyrimidine kinase n=1 Tax=Prevotella sp. GTC17253 TaxID=3236793 RepID=A0AB33IQE5_9BACT